jgi:polysaccharide biosynthesis transport protein
MTESLPRDDVHLHVAVDALRRFGLRIAFAVIVIGGAVGAYAYLGSHSYRSTATVLIRPLAGNALSAQTSTSNQSTTVAMETEVSLVTSLAVTQRVNDALGTHLSSAGGNVSSSVPVNSQIVQITCVASTGREAQRRAQAYAHAFLDYRSDLAAQSRKGRLDRLAASVVAVKQQLQQALTDAKLKVGRPLDADIRVRLLTSNLASLQSEIGQEQAGSTDPGDIVNPAAFPRTPTELSPALLTVGGTLIGLVAAVAIAIWRERKNDRIRASDEATLLDLPVLAVLPDGHAALSGERTKREAVRTEALRRARTSLLAVTPLNSVIMVAGLTDGEPAVTATADLARTVAAAGYRVTVVDAGAAQESRPEWLTGGTGLSNLLDESLPEKLPIRTVDGVQVLGAGSDPGSAAEKYAGNSIRVLLQRLRDNADYVLVATAPADSSEGMAMLLAADGVVLIATDRVSTHEQVASTTAAARRLGAPVLGVVVQQGTDARRDTGSRLAASSPAGRAANSEDAEDAAPSGRAANSEDAEDAAPSGRGVSDADTNGVDSGEVQSRPLPAAVGRGGNGARSRNRRNAARAANQGTGSSPEPGG